MRKLLKILPVIALAFCLHIAPARAQVAVVPPVPVPPSCGVPGLPVCPVGSIALPALFLGFAAFVVYADAEGIDFPLCGFAGLKCYDRYPGDE